MLERFNRQAVHRRSEKRLDDCMLERIRFFPDIDLVIPSRDPGKWWRGLGTSI